MNDLCHNRHRSRCLIRVHNAVRAGTQVQHLDLRNAPVAELVLHDPPHRRGVERGAFVAEVGRVPEHDPRDVAAWVDQDDVDVDGELVGRQLERAAQPPCEWWARICVRDLSVSSKDCRMASAHPWACGVPAGPQ